MEERESRSKQTTRFSTTTSHADFSQVKLLTKAEKYAWEYALSSWIMRNVRFYCCQMALFNKALGKQRLCLKYFDSEESTFSV